MTWFRVDDSLADHPKVLALQEQKQWKGALALWTLAGAWCSKHLTDGAIPRAIVGRLGCSHADAAALVSVGLWETDGETGYRFHDWASRNPTRERVESDRAATKKRVTEYRQKQVSNAVTERVTNDGCTPAPSRPVPTQPNLHTEPDPLGADFFDLVQRAFSEGRVAAGGEHFRGNRSDYDPTHGVVEWCRVAGAKHGDARKALAASLAGYFASKYGKDESFPYKPWANDPGKWVPRGANGSAKPKTRKVLGVEYDDSERDAHGLTAAERAHNRAVIEGAL